MRTDRNLRSETGPLGERQLPQEVIRHIGDRASGLYPELYEKQERAEAEKNHAVSKIIDFANRKYGGQTEEESLQSFVNDLSGQMETQQTNVPPDNQMVDQNNIPEQAESGIDFNSIDSDISPQNMETV